MLSSSSMGVGFDDSIRRRASSKFPHLQRDFRVVLSLCVFVVLGVEVAVMFVLTVCAQITAPLSGKEVHGQILKSRKNADVPLLNSLMDM